MKLNEALKNDFREQILSAPHGTANKVVDAIRENIINPRTGKPISRATVYRMVDITAGEKKAPRLPDIPDKVIDMIASLKAESGKIGVTKRFLRTEDAIEILEESGKLEEGTISATTADRRMREAGWKKKRTYERHEDKYVNQVHHADFSRSEGFEVGINKETGEEVIRVDGRQGVWDYKNKEKSERKRLWVFGYLDSFSRAYMVRYYAATGENLTLGTEALEFMWNREDEVHPLIHLPEVLKFDQGSIGKYLFHHPRFQTETGVRIELSGSKSDRYAERQGQGKIERQFRTLWQRFEVKLVTKFKIMGITEITLEELNTLAHQFCMEMLEMKHPFRNQMRGEVYLSGLRLRPQNVLTRSLWDILYVDSARKVGADKLLSFDGVIYRAPEKFARQRIFVSKTNDGRIIGQDLEKRHTFDLVEFNPDATQATTTHEATYQERMAEQGIDIDGSKLRLVGRDSGAIMPHTLPPLENEVSPDSAFVQKEKKIVAITEWEHVKLEVCEVFGCSWSDLSDGLIAIIRRLFDAKLLDKEAIYHLYQQVS